MTISDKKLQEIIGWTPHERQQAIIESSSRDVVICAGRRFGKSAVCAYLALKVLLEDNKKIWVVAPTYDLTQKVFEYLVQWYLKIVPEGTGGISMRPNPKIQTAWGTRLECKSTENPQGLLGEELDLLIVDEASQVAKNVWETYLYPTTSSRKGRSIFISTPFGKNWFYFKYLEAEAQGGAFHFLSSDNPYFPEGEWERARGMLPEASFKQNYEATFLEDGASVFRGVREIIKPDILRDARGDRSYVMGVDLGKYNDFTVLTVVDTFSHEVVHFDRFKEIDWPLQKGRIVALARRYNNAKAIIDSTGLGDPIASDVSREGILVDDVKISNKSKAQLVEKLSLFIEQKGILIPNNPDLVSELEAFGVDRTEQGKLKYGAPEGFHDDCVISLALAVWGLPDAKVGKSEMLKPNKKKPIRYQYV